MNVTVKRVLVEFEGQYYQCMWIGKDFWKCGKCLFGLINPWGNNIRQDTKCKRCKAKLFKTIFYDGRNLAEYSP